MIRRLSLVMATAAFFAFVAAGCDSSSDSGGETPKVRDVKPGSAGKRPGADLSAQAMNQDPTGTDDKTKKPDGKDGATPPAPK